MLYRRIFLLALVEACGGALGIHDCQRYLSLFCTRRDKNYYDFFPSQHGYQSLVLAQDKRRLASLGLLAEHPDFHLSQKHSYLEQLTLIDQCMLLAVIAEPSNLSEPDFFSEQRQVAGEIPTNYAKGQEIQKKVYTKDQGIDTPCLFTLGYEGISIDAYLNLLVTSHVAVLVDVRRNPLSRKYGFSKKQLIHATSIAGIAYQHIPALGIPSTMRQHLDNETAYQTLFDYYATQMLPEQTKAIEQVKMLLAEAGRIALTCFEADPQFCHRHKITEHLQTDAAFHTPVRHLRKENVVIPHSISKIIGKDVRGHLNENSVYIPI